MMEALEFLALTAVLAYLARAVVCAKSSPM
jgi:hypothetical protein